MDISGAIFLILNFLRWMAGYVSFEIVGGYPEKFINLSVKNNINFWDLKRVGADFKAKIKASEYKYLHSLARVSNSKVSILSRHGLPFFMFKHRKRWGVLAGLGVFLIFLYCCSLYIWRIDVIGNNELSKEEIIKTLDEAGLSPGVLKSRIKPSEIEEFTMSHIGKISWMSVNLEGVTASVEIKERLEKPEILKESEPCNIVALQDGQIERLETYRGVATVEPGSVVTKGQLLISGISESADFKSEFLGAEGKVFAKTKEKIVEKIPLNCVKAEDTGKLIRKIRVKLFGLEIPLWGWKVNENDNLRKEIYLDSCSAFGVDLPIKIYKEFLYEQNICSYELNEEEACCKAEVNLKERESSELKDVNIIEKNVKRTKTDDEYILEAEYTCIKDIGKQEKISFE